MKQTQKKLVGITAALASTTLLAATASASETTNYVVNAGDNLYRLAIQFNTTVNEIAVANNIANPNRIYVNQELVIPTNTNSGSTGSTGSTDSTGSTGSSTAGYHYVVSGDTLSKLAQTYGTTVRQLAAWNNISNVNFIRVGWTLKVSDSASSGSTGSTNVSTSQHLVVRGDNLWDLSIKYGTTVRQLAAWNNIPNIHLIYVGQVLTVSGTGTNTAGAIYGEDTGMEITKDQTPDAVTYEEWLEAMSGLSDTAVEASEEEIADIEAELAEEGEYDIATPEFEEETDLVEEGTVEAEIVEEEIVVDTATESSTVDVAVDTETADVMEANFGDVIELPEGSVTTAAPEVTYDYTEPLSVIPMPAVEEAPVVQNTYTVVAETSIFQLSALFNASVNDLIAWNDIEDTNSIPAGTVLRISL